MSFEGKKLGILISAPPEAPAFLHGVRFAATALEAGCSVYLYCIDLAVAGVGHPELQALRTRGLNFYACAYGAHHHGVPVDDQATFAGRTVVSDLIASTDRFVSFNAA